MPTYVYKCPKCKKTLEQFLTIRLSDAPIICDECYTKMKKIITDVSFKINGKYTAKNGYSEEKKESGE